MTFESIPQTSSSSRLLSPGWFWNIVPPSSGLVLGAKRRTDKRRDSCVCVCVSKRCYANTIFGRENGRGTTYSMQLVRLACYRINKSLHRTTTTTWSGWLKEGKEKKNILNDNMVYK